MTKKLRETTNVCVECMCRKGKLGHVVTWSRGTNSRLPFHGKAQVLQREGI